MSARCSRCGYYHCDCRPYQLREHARDLESRSPFEGSVLDRWARDDQAKDARDRARSIERREEERQEEEAANRRAEAREQERRRQAQIDADIEHEEEQRRQQEEADEEFAFAEAQRDDAEDCDLCGGIGTVHDCGEDVCPCAHPDTDDRVPCPNCDGRVTQ